jgi:hypothetical protein
MYENVMLLKHGKDNDIRSSRRKQNPQKSIIYEFVNNKAER